MLARTASEFMEVLRADMELPHNRYINSPLLQLIFAGRLPRV